MFYGVQILSKNLGANSKFQVPDRLHNVPYWGTTVQNLVAWNLCTPGLRKCRKSRADICIYVTE